MWLQKKNMVLGFHLHFARRGGAADRAEDGC